ncbi:MAG: hypothetical protein KatS3mg130_1632 [Candidatus Sumerlaea sp.]|uniref:Uncharacterized protein n=1 Tax=Sumerlaea chitinivorans TaxID=2250252 RepID=A0A2Z4Y2C9_SUMC1|nr:hypothetical protein BRCON_0289 [Candidatus Sumerlaea chitinivorans]GIX45224.1 MAG: hypothetical protein KatS3mg130_1632 [Candidatus Sumerlaea sp.]
MDFLRFSWVRAESNTLLWGKRQLTFDPTLFFGIFREVKPEGIVRVNLAAYVLPPSSLEAPYVCGQVQCEELTRADRLLFCTSSS